jgi:hypothetical protein
MTDLNPLFAMTTDYRALCAELLEWAERTSSHYYKQAEVVIRARALLAQPEQASSPAVDRLLDLQDRIQMGSLILAEALEEIAGPKPPTLKEQALLQLDTLNADLAMHGMGCDLSQIRRALESLPD